MMPGMSFSASSNRCAPHESLHSLLLHGTRIPQRARTSRRPDAHAGIAIGGDVFPGSTLSDHCLRYQNIPEIKMIVVLGELGGQVRLARPCLAAQKPHLDPSD